jgi:hypothetical protein
MTIKDVGRIGLVLSVIAASAFAASLFLLSLIQPARSQFSAQSIFIAGGNVGGTGNAITLTVANVATMQDLLGVPIRFLPAHTSVAGIVTVAIIPLGGSSLGVLDTYRYSSGSIVPIAGGDISANVLAEIVYDGTEFIQQNPATGTAPVGTEISFIGNGPPPGYLIEDGVCVSTTTYAALYASFGSSDIWSPGSTGGACSAGQFHLPFANGTVAAAVDQQGSVTAGKLTNAVSSCNNTGIGLCGSQNRSLSSTAQLPQFTPSGTVSTVTPAGTIGGSFVSTNGLLTDVLSGGSYTVPSSGTTIGVQQLTVTGSSFSFTGTPATPTFTGVAIGSASPSAFVTVQPTRTVVVAVKY